MSHESIIVICFTVFLCVVVIVLGILIFNYIDNHVYFSNQKQYCDELKRLQKQANDMYAEIQRLDDICFHCQFCPYICALNDPDAEFNKEL